MSTKVNTMIFSLTSKRPLNFFSDLAKLEPHSLVTNLSVENCHETLNNYEQLITTFTNLLSELKQNNNDSDSGNVTQLIEDYQTALYNYKTVKDLNSHCYWFEQHLWWRKGPKLRCFPGEIHRKTTSTVQVKELNDFKKHVKGTGIILIVS